MAQEYQIKIHKGHLPFKNTQTEAFYFVPNEPNVEYVGLFTHGYTSHKGTLLTWSSRLAEEGIPSVIFDIPGHYLGSFNEVEDFKDFENDAPKLFSQALTELQKKLPHNEIDLKIVLGGHSLGALLALLASEMEIFKENLHSIVCVGLGMMEEGNYQHVFQTPFFKSTLALRAQLVSKALHPDLMFEWLKKTKEGLTIQNKNIHLISGENDIVVTQMGAERMRDKLLQLGNQVTLEKPRNLSHHMPEEAASFVKRYFRSIKSLA